VALFLEGRIRFLDISRLIHAALERLGDLPGDSRESLLAADAAARHQVRELSVC
jgi:1-deoxy-D-xylulose 5-phosphate reductoisomerase